MHRRPRFPPGDDGQPDLVPLIDCVFLLLLFFMLCGRLSTDGRTEQITVPPARSATKPTAERPRVILNLRDDGRPLLAFGGEGGWIPLTPAGWSAVRTRLDAVWNRSAKRRLGGIETADIVIEIRADGDVPFAIVQRLQLICADAIDPATFHPRPMAARPFCDLDLTARPAG